MPTIPLVQSYLGKSALDYDTFTDSVSKFRVSTPQSMIDTDFEYSLQNTKWETLQLVNNIPTFFSRSGDASIPLQDVNTRSNNLAVYVTSTGSHGFSVGQPFLIQGLTNVTAEGAYTISRIISSNMFAYNAKDLQYFTKSIYDPYATILYPGQYYTGSLYNYDQLGGAITTDGADPSVLSVTTNAPHGFSNNTFFNVSASVADRTYTINASTQINNTSSIITTPTPHYLIDTTPLVYNNNGNANIANLVTGNTYYAINAVGNTFQLSASNTYPGPIVPIKSAVGTHIFKAVDYTADFSYYSVINSSNTSFQLQAPFQILPTSNIINVRTDINLQNNTFIIPRHGMVTGAPVFYTSNLPNIPNTVPIAPLQFNSTYYTIRDDMSTIRIASTYMNALAQSNIDLTSNANYSSPYPFASSSNHLFIFPSITGETFGSGQLQTTAGSTLVTLPAQCNILTNGLTTGYNVNVLSSLKIGSTFRMEYVNFASNIIVTKPTAGAIFTAALPMYLNPLNGLGYKVLSSTIPALSNNYIYYTRYVSPTTFNLTNSYLDAINNTNLISFAITAGTTIMQRLTSNIIFESKIADIYSSTSLALATPAPLSTWTLNSPYNTSNYILRSALYPTIDGYCLHRPFDGGVELIPAKSPDSQLIRQTRRVFRYQPGKGIQVSLSVNFSPPIILDYLTSNLTTGIATGYTKKPHRLTPGLLFNIYGTNSVWDSPANNYYTISDVPDIYYFNFYTTPNPTITLANPAPSVAPGFPNMDVKNWSGAAMRVGHFDDTNGIFYEFDGTSLYAVRRDSVSQATGTIFVENGSQAVTGLTNLGVSTVFTKQLTVGKNIAIRGMVYKIVNIVNDSLFYVQPPYRGITNSNVIISLITDTKIHQSQWNLDKCDGTGPTGYNINYNKIQMIYLDYSWYGAGKARFGVKDNKGVVRYVHDMIHNNQLDLAYFRTGNLPGRYEVVTVGQPTWVPALMHWGTSIVMDGGFNDDFQYLYTSPANILSWTNGETTTSDTTAASLPVKNIYDSTTRKTVAAFPTQVSTVAANYIKYATIKSGTFVTGTGGNLPTGTYTVGSAYISGTITYMYLTKRCTAAGAFTFGDPTDIVPIAIPIISIRLSPSVDNGNPGVMGSREIVNRMQLKPFTIDIMTTHDVEIRLVLNGLPSTHNWQRNTIPSLTQYIAHNKNDTLQDGTNVFQFRSPGGGVNSLGSTNPVFVRTTNLTSIDLTQLGAIGNAILGGDNVYPDGPDIFTLMCYPLDLSITGVQNPFQITARFTWSESQA